MNLGTKLKHVLKEKNLTVTELARRSGVPAQTIYALINRDSNKADMDIMEKILNTLELDFFAFMNPGGGNEKNREIQLEKKKETERQSTEGKDREETAEHREKGAVWIEEDVVKRLKDMAKEAGIVEPDMWETVLAEYIEEGFRRRPDSFREILQRHTGRRALISHEMDDYLL